MKKTLLLIPFVFGLSSLAWSGTCVSDPLSDYDAPGFSCTLGDLTYSDFNYIPTDSGGALSPPASGVTVTPITTGFGSDIGLEFTAAWLVASGQTIDSSISYDVSTTNPVGITDLFLYVVGGAGGDGVASVAEGSLTPPESLYTEFASGTTINSASASFSPVGSLSLTKDIGLSGGSGPGGAHISDVYNLISEGTSTVPEPPLAILCIGLLGLVPMARSKFVH
jgi:hypothetical protein